MIVNENNLKEFLQNETIRIEWKEKEILNSNNDKIAIALISLANRYGGVLLFGVKNNGELENVRFQEDEDGLKIHNIAHNNCSPPINCSTKIVNCNGSEVLVVTVQKRNDIPHAVIKRENGEIKTRRYYIRSGKGNRLVDDITLNYLFKNLEDPELQLHTIIKIWSNTKKLIFFQPFEFVEYEYYFIRILQNIHNDIKKKEYLIYKDNISELLLEVIPYSFLSNLSSLFFTNWKIKIDKSKGKYTVSSLETPLQNKQIHILNIGIKGLEHVEKVIDLKKVFDLDRDFINVPPNTEIEIEVNKSHNNSTIIIKNPSFNINIAFTFSFSAIGLPPEIFQKYLTLSQDEFAFWEYDVRFNSHFSFPDKEDEYFNEYYYFVKTIYDLVNEKWNWDDNSEIIKDQKIDLIHYKIEKILSILNNRENIKDKV